MYREVVGTNREFLLGGFSPYLFGQARHPGGVGRYSAGQITYLGEQVIYRGGVVIDSEVSLVANPFALTTKPDKLFLTHEFETTIHPGTVDGHPYFNLLHVESRISYLKPLGTRVYPYFNLEHRILGLQGKGLFKVPEHIFFQPLAGLFENKGDQGSHVFPLLLNSDLQTVADHTNSNHIQRKLIREKIDRSLHQFFVQRLKPGGFKTKSSRAIFETHSFSIAISALGSQDLEST